MSRWKVVVGAVLVQLSLGAIYAWSVFTPALKAAGWTKLDTQVVFSVGLLTFALVMVWAGRALAKWGPRRLAVASGLTLGAGYVLAGILGATNFWVVTICIGLIGGAGIGIGYVVPIAVGMRWFPDKKGMITGLAVAGFGFGAMAWVKLAGAWGQLIESLGLANTFMTYGVAFAALILGGSVWMRMPPAGWSPEGYVSTANDSSSGGEDFTVREMLRTPQFYLITMTFAVSAAAGLMSIGSDTAPCRPAPWPAPRWRYSFPLPTESGGLPGARSATGSAAGVPSSSCARHRPSSWLRSRQWLEMNIFFTSEPP
jgi:OFA family oxalate/formate antiporter-like MFS transporter